MRPRTYRIVVDGHLDESFVAGLDGASQRYEDPATVLEGEFVDQSHLHGLLDRLRSLGIEIIEFSTLSRAEEASIAENQPLDPIQERAGQDLAIEPTQPSTETGAIALLEVPTPDTQLHEIPTQREPSAWRRVWFGVAGFFLLLVVVVAALAIPHLGEGTGERTYHPTSFEAVAPHYEFGIGSLTIDLRDVDFPAGTHRITVDHGIGSARVFLPADVAYDVTADLAAGEIDVFGDTANGFDNDLTSRTSGSADALVIVDLEVDIGYGRVRHG